MDKELASGEYFLKASQKKAKVQQEKKVGNVGTRVGIRGVFPQGESEESQGPAGEKGG